MIGLWFQKNSGNNNNNHGEKREGVNGIVAVAIDKEKGSQYALKWAAENLLTKSATVLLIHVKIGTATLTPSISIASRASSTGGGSPGFKEDGQSKSIFLPYRIFCTRKDIKCKDVLLQDVDVAKAIIDYTSHAGISHLVLGCSAKTSLLKRFKVSDIPATVAKNAADFCTVYIVSKGRIQSIRYASRPAPIMPPIQFSQASMRSDYSNTNVTPPLAKKEQESQSTDSTPRDGDLFRSPFTRRAYIGRSYGDSAMLDSDISFVSSRVPSQEIFNYDLNPDIGISQSNSRLSCSSDTHANQSITESTPNERKSTDISSPNAGFSNFSYDSDKSQSSTSLAVDDVEAEIRRLKLELKQTIDKYSSACKEAYTAQQKAVELERWKDEEVKKLDEAKLAEEAAVAMAEKEKAKSRAAIEAAQMQEKVAELEARKRISAELKALREKEKKKQPSDELDDIINVRYRRYDIEDIEVATEYFAESKKIGEGGYGPVYQCFLDHTSVAVKVLRPDAAQGRSQFKREVEVLSSIRHPNMVLLLGACPEFGCLVYEYMANGSLDDRLHCRGNTPPLTWQLRFKIAAEIGTGLLFLHNTKPEPLVHRDLKPANILLDSNYVAKISDVGLARLVPPSVADTVTQYYMTSAAGTFCYIDPEYQQTGMLGVKSDIYSLGIIFLQILTGRPPMGLAHHVENAIENGNFGEMLDPQVTDWPIEEAMSLAKMALQCAELRRRDRPDLGKVVQPELNRLRDIAERSNPHSTSVYYTSVPHPNQVSVELDKSCPNASSSASDKSKQDPA